MLYENGEFERIRPHLTPLECGIIFDGIPEGAISRKVGLIWGIPVYINALGMSVTRRMELEGEFVSQVLGFPNAHGKAAFMDRGEGHQLELIQYINPPSGTGGVSRNDLGATHLAFYVEDIDRFYTETSQRGLRFINPPAVRLDDSGNVQIKIALSQDPDSNWLEFIETF